DGGREPRPEGGAAAGAGRGRRGGDDLAAQPSFRLLPRGLRARLVGRPVREVARRGLYPSIAPLTGARALFMRLERPLPFLGGGEAGPREGARATRKDGSHDHI